MGKVQIRIPVVAGQFYPGTKNELTQEIARLVKTAAVPAQKKEVLGCVLPHAGYMYSGQVAAAVVAQINLKEKIILLGPNHTGYGEEFSLMSEGIWQTPLGEVPLDSSLAQKLLAQSRYLKKDDLAHTHEHSLEVELPFLQYFKTHFQIVPIAVLSQDLGALKEVGQEIAKVIKDNMLGDKITLIASSDMTHYESQAQVEKKDKLALAAILELNADKLMQNVKEYDISMCGVAPVAILLSAAKELGAKKAAVIKYQTSGDILGDYTSVVGYAGITVS